MKIRLKIINEVYKMTPEEEKTSSKYGPDARRALGLQSQEEIEADKDFLRSYQETADIDSFRKQMGMQGNFTIMHKIGYVSSATRLGKKSTDTKDLGGWVKTFGMTGNDTLSCVGFPKNVKNLNFTDYMGLGDRSFNAKKLIQQGSYGLFLEGYPVLVAKEDVNSQTLGALPPGLEQHQQSSGISKRGNPDSKVWKSFREMASYGEHADEVLLDNWSVIGFWFVSKFYDPDGRYAKIRTMAERDAAYLGIPFIELTSRGVK